MLYVNVLGIALIAAIVWWFWLYKPQQVVANNNQVNIVVNHGVYQPSAVSYTHLTLPTIYSV